MADKYDYGLGLFAITGQLIGQEFLEKCFLGIKRKKKKKRNKTWVDAWRNK